jgi:hypothetical protein
VDFAYDGFVATVYCVKLFELLVFRLSMLAVPLALACTP